MDYEKMWKNLKSKVKSDIDFLYNEKTTIDYSNILRMATAKIVLQSMNEIEETDD